MTRLSSPARLSPARLLPVLLLSLLAGCGSLAPRDPLHVALAGIDPLPSQSLIDLPPASQPMEVRFAVDLRIQNPNDSDIHYDGVALEVELNGQPLASGVTPAVGVIPRFGEALVRVPVTVSAYSVLRQGWGVVAYKPGQGLPYAVRGKLSTGSFSNVHFEDRGDFDWPPTVSR